MVQTADVLSKFPDIGAGQLKASARGGLICALFGSAWMYWAVVFSGHPTPMWFSAVNLPAITLTLEIIPQVFVDRFRYRMGARGRRNISAVAYWSL